MAQTLSAPPGGEDWRAKLNLPAKDTRIQTEVNAWLTANGSAEPRKVFISRYVMLVRDLVSVRWLLFLCGFFQDQSQVLYDSQQHLLKLQQSNANTMLHLLHAYGGIWRNTCI